jgi:glycosyltransferase involved in cell wall biosynthesis
MSRRKLRLLFMPREPFPTDRVRINVLFGRELLSRGHEIDLAMQAADERVATGARPWFGRTLWVGPTDSANSMLHRLRKHWLALCFDLRSLRRARREQYDALLISDKFLLAAVGVVVAHLRGVKFIFWLTFPYPQIELARARARTARYPALAWLRGAVSGWVLHRWILPLSDHVFVQSDRMLRDICSRGADPRKMSPIVTGFGLAEIPVAAGPRVAEDCGTIVLSYLGTLSSDRHLEVLIDMLACLREGGLKVELMLVGAADMPRDRSILEERAARLRVGEHVTITGFLPQAQALECISRSDICLSPIYRSAVYDVGSPTKLIEYLALGMPVVANDHPEQRLILRESRAGVCVPWGGRYFARAVRWLLRHGPQERTAMGARGRAWVVANRTYSRIADEVERTCLAVVAERAVDLDPSPQ